MVSSLKKVKPNQLEPFSLPYYPKSVPTKKYIDRYVHSEENKPINKFRQALRTTEQKRAKVEPGKFVGHLFYRDFRLQDNQGLSQASEFSTKHGIPLVTIYLFCHENLFAHSVSPFQLEYRLRALREVQDRLKSKNIPLKVISVEKRGEIVDKLAQFLQEHQISHLFSNVEYEVDELRFATKTVETLLEKDMAFFPAEDCCVVKPGELSTKSKGTQYAVFTPWHRAWSEYVNSKASYKPFDDISDNKPLGSNQLKKLSSEVPNPPPEKQLSKDQLATFDKTWKAGESAALESLKSYVKSSRIKDYKNNRSDISADATSHISCHLSSGTVSARTVVRIAMEANDLKKVDAGDPGTTEWIRQIAWRDFYKHVLCNWPYICMHRPFLLEYNDLEWEYNKSNFEKWCQGETGFPVVDAAMRQLNQTGYMPNRCRMIVASFLSKHLLIDWRYGEFYFMSHLIDADFASNNGGWGFSSGIGVDPQPFFRIFNPWTQASRFDKNGKYVKRWVPELKEIAEPKGLHDPYGNGYAKVAKKTGYPEPIVDHKFARQRALDRFDEARH